MKHKYPAKWRFILPALELTAAAGLVCQLFVLARSWGLLPDVVPVHFNFLGQADAIADKSSLLVLLALNIFAYVALSWLGRNPDKMNLVVKIDRENKNDQYYLAAALAKVLKVHIVWLFAFITIQTVTIAHDPEQTLGVFFVPLVITTMLATLVGYLFVSLRYERRA